ncbi:MAG: hypothetical protein P1U87_17500 [Verrucomicrobiales bacterium]|nr:hypothetical protein [Verrucomicrobiales bacterium]
MKLTFQTVSLFILVTMVHLVVLVGFSRFSDEPSTILSDLNGEEILEEWFGEEEQAPPSAEMVGGGEEKKLPDNPIARADTDAQPGPDLRDGALPEDRSAERDEVSAIVDARFLSGRIEAPNVEAYVSEPTPVVKPELNPVENPVESEEPPVPDLKAEPVAASPVERAKKQEAPVVEAPVVEGPRKIRSIRPISG